MSQDELLDALVKAAIELAITRHDLVDDCGDSVDVDAITLDVCNALKGIDTCDQTPASEWTEVRSRLSKGLPYGVPKASGVHCSCDHGCTSRFQMRARHGDPIAYKGAVVRVWMDGFINSDEALAAAAKYKTEYEAAPETETIAIDGDGRVGSRCPACGLPQFPCPSGLTCANGHGY